MFKNILIASGGSELAAKAVGQGIVFAKEIGAKITAVTVTEPFNALSLAPRELEYTPIDHQHFLGRGYPLHGRALFHVLRHQGSDDPSDAHYCGAVRAEAHSGECSSSRPHE